MPKEPVESPPRLLPIGTLRFASALLEHDVVRQDPHRLAKVASTVKSSTDRLAWLVENLQRIARISEPVDLPSEQLVDLTALADEVARQLGEMASGRQVAIRIERDLPTLTADPARLELVLLNLLANAIKAALAKEGSTVDDLDLVEINEAFASVGIHSTRELGLDGSTVNVNGGAIAMGHPIGMSGARLALHLALELKRRGGGTGAAALCGGGGQGDALILRVPKA